jgi:hypothetical protein
LFPAVLKMRQTYEKKNISNDSLVCYEGKDNLYKACNVCNVMRVKTNLYKNLY